MARIPQVYSFQAMATPCESTAPSTPAAPAHVGDPVRAPVAVAPVETPSGPPPLPLTKKVRVRSLERDDSLAHLTGLLHRAYKQHADRGIKALAAFQPEEVTRRRRPYCIRIEAPSSFRTLGKASNRRENFWKVV